MLKLTFVFESNIRCKSSRSRLPLFYNKFYTLLFLFSTHINKNNFPTDTFKHKFTLRKLRTVIMRSPFHYKTSKTILAKPNTKIYLSLVITNLHENNLFLNKNFTTLVQSFNANSNFSCTKVVCKDLTC